MPGPVITLLGLPSVSRDASDTGAPLPAKALALLAYLALEPGLHGREELAALLWGDSPEADARASLRQALHQLRARVGPTLRCERNAVALEPPFECDVLRFRELVGRDPRAAAEFDPGRFLLGLTVRHAPGFDDWVAATRRTLLREAQTVWEQVARDAMSRGSWREAADWAERWLRSDPLSDAAVRVAVEAAYLGGDRGAALARFAAYRDRLARETGCAPSRPVLALVARIEADDGARSRPIVDDWYVRAPAFEAGLVGREQELRTLQAAWRSVGSVGGAVVLLEGEAGVGKSRLAEEFLRWVRTEGGAVLRGRGYDAWAGVPYGPLVEVLHDATGAPGVAATPPEWLAEASRLVPELRHRFPGIAEPGPLADATEGVRLAEGMAQVLAAVAGEQPAVVWIDDLQWADAETVRLLPFLVHRLAEEPVLWMAGLTLGELERDAPAAGLVRRLRGRERAAVITLEPLDVDQVWQLIRQAGHVGGARGGQRFAAQIHRATGGNPFYVIEQLKTLFAQGLVTVDPETGDWTISGDGVGESGDLPLARSVHGAIAERLDRLPDELRSVLLTLAVARTGVSVEILSHAHGISRLHAAALGDALVERRLATEENSAYRCAHPVIAGVVRDRLTGSRLREVHRSLAVALAAVAGDSPMAAAAIARHADRGGERALAVRWALAAADQAQHRGAHDEALIWLDIAAANARTAAEADVISARTAAALEAAGRTHPLDTGERAAVRAALGIGYG